jgi:polysaccharide export outer membrane protein
VTALAAPRVAAQASAVAAGEVASSRLPDAPRPGDVIRLRIWREPDLSGDFPVDQSGVVIFPKIGPIVVSVESPDSLRAKLVRAYQEYLRNPSIDVTLLRRVNILGAVRSPGLYPVDATMTVADALALAGGTTPQGDPRKIELIRNGKRLIARVSRNTRIADAPIRSGDQLYVPERGWVSRNAIVVASAITASASLIIALARR